MMVVEVFESLYKSKAKSFFISGKNIDYLDSEYFIEQFCENKPVQTTNLAGSYIWDDAAQVYADFIRKNKIIDNINLPSNSIGRKCAKQWREALL